ncbi:galactokinase [Muriicola marianensis]|nr:galactokinase [Muriicola marianensis]
MDQGLINSVRSSFRSQFGTNPVLIWSPGRINIIGEHTDYNRGFVMPAAIDRGIVMAMGKAAEGNGKWIATYVKEVFSPGSLPSHPENRKGWQAYLMGIHSELGKKGIFPDPVDLVFSGNIPPGAGLSSSAALENAFVYGLNEIYELGLSPTDMVSISHAAEWDYVGVKCGIMDQYASMFGQEGKAIFLDCRSMVSEMIPANLEGYQWLLLDTGVKHNLADSAYNQRREVCEAIATRLGANSLRELSVEQLEQIRSAIPAADYQKALYVLEENERVLRAREAIKRNDLKKLGELMYLSHKGLAEQYAVSCEELDFLVDLAKETEGVLGARMMGGGFGGCTLNLVHENEVQTLLKKALNSYRERFDLTLKDYPVRFASGCCLVKSI